MSQNVLARLGCAALARLLSVPLFFRLTAAAADAQTQKRT
jgi:hypothetical protein